MIKATDTERKEWGGTIKQLRSAKGWTQKRLADEAGVSIEAIAKMEGASGGGRGMFQQLIFVMTMGNGNRKKVR